MPKVKFNMKCSDKVTGEIYEPSEDFVDVSEQFAARLKDLQFRDIRHKDSFEFAKGRPVGSGKEKDKDKADD